MKRGMNGTNYYEIIVRPDQARRGFTARWYPRRGEHLSVLHILKDEEVVLMKTTPDTVAWHTMDIWAQEVVDELVRERGPVGLSELIELWVESAG